MEEKAKPDLAWMNKKGVGYFVASRLRRGATQDVERNHEGGKDAAHAAARAMICDGCIGSGRCTNCPTRAALTSNLRTSDSAPDAKSPSEHCCRVSTPARACHQIRGLLSR